MSEPDSLHWLEQLTPALCQLAKQAGEVLLSHWHTDLQVERKSDESPVTVADRQSHALLTRGLAELTPVVPVLSEEDADQSHELRRNWSRFWLVDPLDGTKDFLAGRDEFAVLLALIHNSAPLFGLVHAPARGVCCWGGPDMGAFRQQKNQAPEPIATCRAAGPRGPLVLHSRSHRTPKLDAYLESLPHERMPVGSGLKFALLAAGTGQLYPCLHPTYEWDTAAGQALVEGAGGTVTDLEGKPLAYNKPDLLNPPFLAKA